MSRGAGYAELVAFVVVAQESNFRRAAVRLELSPSALSHTIRALEERMGTRLLNRTTRSVSMTEAGRELLDRIAPAFEDINGAVAAVQSLHDRPRGTVRLNLPKVAATALLTPAFGEFARLYPDIHLDLTIDDELSDIVAGGFDAGIRPGERVQRDMVSVRVTPQLPMVIVGSPAYFATRPPPSHPRDLAGHAGINYRWNTSGALYRWNLARRGQKFEVSVEGSLTTTDADAVARAAVAGFGLAFTLESQVAEDLAHGRLVRVLEDWCPPFPGFFLYYPGRRQLPVPLRKLVDFLRVRA